MSYQEFVRGLTPDVVDRLRKGIETGRWPDGRPLTAEQREHSLQAIIAWDREHLPEQERVGYIDKGAKARRSEDDASPLRWADDSRVPASDEASDHE